MPPVLSVNGNTFEIEAKGDTISVVLNGEQVTQYKVDPLRPPAGHIGLQNHHPGSQAHERQTEPRVEKRLA